MNKLTKSQAKLVIGIDCGVQTGFAVWNRELKILTYIVTIKIHEAMQKIGGYHSANPGNVFVRVEDARKRKWFDKKKIGPEQLQGAGSIKRDSVIWEDYLTDLGVEFEMVAPKDNATKLDAKRFKMATGWDYGVTSVHGRDAAMLVFNS